MLNEDVYTPGTAWGPRIGAAYDLTGKGTTALKAFSAGTSRALRQGSTRPATPGVEDYARTPILRERQSRPARSVDSGHPLRHQLGHQPSTNR